MSEKQLPPIDSHPLKTLDELFRPIGQIFLLVLIFGSLYSATKSVFASSIAPVKKAQPEFAEALQNNPINSLTLTLSTLTFLALGAIIVTVLKRRGQTTPTPSLKEKWAKAPPAAIGLLALLMLWIGTQLFTAPVISFFIPSALSSNNPTLTEDGQSPHDVEKSKAFSLNNLLLPRPQSTEDNAKKEKSGEPPVDKTKSHIESRFAAGFVLFPKTEDPVLLNDQELKSPLSLQHGDVIQYKERKFVFQHVIKDPKSKLLGSALSKLLVTLFLIGLVALVAMSKSPGTKIDLALQGLSFKGALGEVARGARLYFAFLPVIVAIVGGTSILAGWLGLNQVPHPIQSFLADFDSSALILAFLVAVIGAPIQEEIIFRGLLLPALGKLVPLPLAMIVSAWFFGSMHLGFHSVIPITGLGLFFAYLTVTAPNRSIIASITAHMIHNSLSLGLFLAVHHVTSA